uniref:ERCC4 domain-containing protein n=1 Tax=viral metagenome TaxID=1070528 RepID=A0A6M3KXJ7_9ZZZZ
MILIDPRAGSKELLAHLPPTLAAFSRLDYGDAAWLGNGPKAAQSLVGVEVKSISDLLNSMTTGRLAGHQLIGLMNSYNVIYLLIYGAWRANPDDGLLELYQSGKWRTSSRGRKAQPAIYVENFLNTLSICCGIVVRMARSPKDAARVILSLYNWWQKDWDQHRSHKALSKSRLPTEGIFGWKASLLKQWGSCLPGIGDLKLDAVEAKFDNPLAMALADISEWQEIEGVGKKTAERVVNAIRGKEAIR